MTKPIETIRKLAFGESAKRCDNCRFYKQVQEKAGYCMYHPPVPKFQTVETIGGPKGTYVGIRPSTTAAEFCAMHSYIDRLEPQKS